MNNIDNRKFYDYDARIEDSFLNFIRQSWIGRKVEIRVSPNKKYEGVLGHVDGSGNLTVKLEDGVIHIQRQYVVSVKELVGE